MRQQPLELGAICARVEHVVLATPDQERRQRRRAQLVLEPAEARKCTGMIVERNPARPGPGQQSRRRIGQDGRIGGLGARPEFFPVYHRQIDAARGERVVASEQIRPGERRVHDPPREYAGMELGRRQRPRPGAHQHQRTHTLSVGQREAEAGRAAPIVADQRDALEIELAQQRREIGDMAVETMRVFPRRLLRKPESDHVGDDHAAPGRRQRFYEIAIEKAPGRVAVQQHQRIAGSLVDVVHAPAVHAGEVRPVRPQRTDRLGQVGQVR